MTVVPPDNSFGHRTFPETEVADRQNSVGDQQSAAANARHLLIPEEFKRYVEKILQFL